MMDRPLPVGADWPPHWRNAPLWAMFDRVKDVGHADEEMLSVYREHGVIQKSSRDDNTNQTAENRNIYQLVDSGWFIVNRMKAWQGSVGVSTLRGIVSGHYLCFRPRHGENPRFLNWLLRSSVYATEYARMSRGVRPGQIEIDNDELRGLRVALPPSDEQRRIADFLDAEVRRVEDLIHRRRMQRMLLGERAIGALLGSVLVENDAWVRTRLKYLFDFARNGIWGGDAKGDADDLTCVRVADFKRDRYRADPQAATLRSVPPAAARDRILRRGDILLEKSGGGEQSPVGFAVTFDSDARSVCSNFIAALRAASGVDPRFACLLLAAIYRSGRNIPYIKQATGIQNLDGGAYLSQEVRVPNEPMQIQIAQRFDRELEQLLAVQSSMDRQITLLAERRQALITAAVTGQIDVTTARGVAV